MVGVDFSLGLLLSHLAGPCARLFLSILLVDKVFKGAGGEDVSAEPPHSVAEFLHSRRGISDRLRCIMLTSCAQFLVTIRPSLAILSQVDLSKVPECW